MEKLWRRVHLACITGVVLGLHALLAWMLLLTPRSAGAPLPANGLRLVYIAPAPRPRLAFDGHSNRLAATRTPAPDHTPIFRMPPDSTAPGTNGGQGGADDAPRTPDWDAEHARAAELPIPEGARPGRSFGFPQVRPSPAPVPDFGWSHSRTHRVEAIPGGIIVNLNDNCVLVFNPLPFIGCATGKRPANGELFKHMHDPTSPDGSDEVK